MARALPTLPPVTDEHRHAAFAAMGWLGWTYEQAMADDLRARRQQRWTRTPWPPLRAAGTDLKRAAAGDRDD